MNMTITNAWPTDLPLPAIDHQGTMRNTTLVGQAESANILRRMRLRRAYASINATWVLNLTQFDLFQEFVNTTLGNAAAMFTIDLRYPKTSVLTSWVARFTAEYNAQFLDGPWQVNGQLDLFGTTVIGEAL